MALIRYPGSKEKLRTEILRAFPDEFMLPLCMASSQDYREPFFGAGAVGFKLLESMRSDCNVWLNDKDYGMVALWKAVQEQPVELCRLIKDFRPSVSAFEEFKATDGDSRRDPVLVGFRKLALHQMSFSGFGYKAGGPLGGIDQKSDYKVDCRWSSVNLRKDVDRLHRLLKKFGRKCRITCKDFSEVLVGAGPRTFIYLDPPYYEEGPNLYKFSLQDQDHHRLATILRTLKCKWVLSYDDHPRIRGLYSWCKFRELEITYTNAIAKKGERPKNREVVIEAA